MFLPSKGRHTARWVYPKHVSVHLRLPLFHFNLAILNLIDEAYESRDRDSVGNGV